MIILKVLKTQKLWRLDNIIEDRASGLSGVGEPVVQVVWCMHISRLSCTALVPECFKY